MSWVDQRFAIEAEVFRQIRFREEPLFVVDIRPHHVIGGDAGNARGMQYRTAGIEQFSAVAAGGAHIHNVIEGRQRDRRQTRAGARNLHRIHHPQRRLDGRHELGAAHFPAALAFNPLNVRFQFMDIFFAVGFRQTYHVHTRAYHRFKVGKTKRRIQWVNAHHGFDILIQRMLQRLIHQQTSGIFLAQRNGIFQVEHHRIGAVDE